MSLQTRIGDLITAVGTDIKLLRTYISGSSTGTLSGLTTTDKTSLVAAINETKAGNSGTPPDATEVVKGIAMVASQTDVTTGTNDAKMVTPLKLATRLSGISAQPDASTSVKGIVQLATNAEGIAGVDAVKAMVPSAVAAVFTDRIDTSVALGASNVKIPSQAAVKAYADALIGAADAMVYKGVINASTNPNYPAADAGWTYRISVAGKIGGASGTNVEVGDMIIATVDGSVTGTQAAVGANWNVIQANIDGAVTGPVSSIAGNLPSFSGTTGKVLADSGFAGSNAAIGAGSATLLPTSAQVVAYSQPLDSDLTAIAALVTTTYGRAFLTLADQTALMNLLAAATETVAGKIAIATQVETTTGTNDTKSLTPLKYRTDQTSTIGNPETDLAALYATAKA